MHLEKDNFSSEPQIHGLIFNNKKKNAKYTE